MKKLISQGAEAKIFLFGNSIVKDRIKKSYRHPELDKQIRQRRTKAETKLLEKASKIINCPTPEKLKENYQIKMPFIEGEKLSENLNSFSIVKQKKICRKIGESVARLHSTNIIHGDLTTSNMILVKRENLAAHKGSQKNKKVINKKQLGDLSLTTLSGASRSMTDAEPFIASDPAREKFKVYFIDFGLGYISKKYEDKAVDVHLFKQALEAKHFKNWEVLFREFVKGYESVDKKEAEKVLNQMRKVERRGRYRGS